MDGSLVAATILFVAVSVEAFLVVLFIFVDGVLYHAAIVNKENAKPESHHSLYTTLSQYHQNTGFPDATSIATTNHTTVDRIRETVTANIEYTTTSSPPAWDCVPRHGVYGGNLNVTWEGHPCVPWIELWELADNFGWWPLQLKLIPTANYFDESLTDRGNKCRNKYNSTTEFVCYYYDYDWDEYTFADCDVRTCDEDIDECSPSLCVNGATCVDEQYGYHCVCAERYTGDRCEVEIGACHENGRYAGNLSFSAFGTPCLNWKLLFMDVSDFDLTLFPDDHTWEAVSNKCRHPSDVVEGPFCFVHIPEPELFLPEPCHIPACQVMLHSPCPESSAEADCIPRHGVYGGNLAEDCRGTPCVDWRMAFDTIYGHLAYYDDINLYPDELWEELGNKCRNPGYFYSTPWCIVSLGNNQLEIWRDCNAGFCEHDVDECSPNLCVNGGTCVDGYYGYTCQCHDGYHGEFCQLESGECRLGTHYEGSLRFAANDQPCINWDTLVVYATFLGIGPQFNIGSWSDDMGSACRYPFEWDDKPFCFVIMDDSIITHQCQIPQCPGICSRSEPCLNGGTCVYEGTRCECNGFEGTICETELDECTSEPCLHGATCEDQINAFVCHCTEFYTGIICDRQIMPCDSNPCQRGGTCINREDNGEYIFTCQCLVGFVGDVCQTDVDECASNPCQNGGQCSDALNSYTCQCEHPFTGDLCETAIFPCDSSPCHHNSTCTDGGSGYTCQCSPGYTGDECQIDIDECASNPCEHGGQCMDAVYEFTCECEYPYHGDACDTETTCFPRGALKHLYKSTTSQTSFGEPCISWSTTIQSRFQHDPGDFRNILGLQHFPDHTWDEVSNHCRNPTQEDEGPWCMYGTSLWDWWYCEIEYCSSETADECWPNPCMNGGTCVDGVDSFTCECDDGYTGMLCQFGDCYSPSILYSGRTNVDWSGRPCVSWENVVEIGVVASNILNSFPDNSYHDAANYCRRFNGGEPLCYTLQYMNFERTYVPEVCGIPQCTAPDCRIEGGIYAGSFTRNGCWHWQDIHELDIPMAKAIAQLSNFPDSNWHMLANKCRNPGRSPTGEFCMRVIDNQLQRLDCDIPECSDGDACTVYPCLNGGTCMIGGSNGEGRAYICQCPDGYHGALCESEDCRFRNTVYEGTLSITENGYACLPWTLTNQIASNVLDDFDFDLEAASDYCRSPSQEFGSPFCFVLKDEAVQRDYCNIPACEGEDDCVHDDTVYTGDVTMDTCVLWEDVQYLEINDNPLPLELFPDNTWSELAAKCRNPTHNEVGLWCPILQDIGEIVVSACHLPTCHETVSRCSRNPCMNGATCVDEDQAFTCQCPDGYTGALCETGDCFHFYDYYTGNTDLSSTGKRCFPWALLETPSLDAIIAEFYFESSLEYIGNRCRNKKDLYGQPPECYIFENNVLVLQQCNVSQCPSTECVVPGLQYTGDATFARCLRWEDLSHWTDITQIQLIARLSNFPDASYEDLAAKCRNPNDDPRGEWCLISNEELTPHYCRLPTCSDRAPCSQSPCLNGATCVDEQDGGFTCLCENGFIGVLCESGDCIDGMYTGDLSITTGGHTCLHWVDAFRYFTEIDVLTEPRTYAMLDVNEAGNKCRDALHWTASAPWCAVFVNGYIGIEQCALPPCPDATTECVQMSAIPKYSGTLTAGNDVICATWSALDFIPQVPMYPVLNGALDDDENLCRDVYDIGRPLCISMTQNGTLEPGYCNIPMCAAYMMDDCSPNHCLNGGTCVDGHDTFTCTCPPGYWGELCESNECITGDGANYAGELSISSSRRPCMNWQKYFEYTSNNSLPLDNFPDQTWEQVGKKCRNPDPSSYSVPFCMVQNIFQTNLFVRSECALPQC